MRAWAYGKARARQAALTEPLFQLAGTVVTLAVPTAIGYYLVSAHSKWPWHWQAAMVVLSGIVGYLVVPVAWAAGAAVQKKKPWRAVEPFLAWVSAGDPSMSQDSEQMHRFHDGIASWPHDFAPPLGPEAVFMRTTRSATVQLRSRVASARAVVPYLTFFGANNVMLERHFVFEGHLDIPRRGPVPLVVLTNFDSDDQQLFSGEAFGRRPIPWGAAVVAVRVWFPGLRFDSRSQRFAISRTDDGAGRLTPC
jgi:hypothetical protein